MEVIRGRNVNDMFALGVNLLAAEGRRSDSRDGPVIVMPCPVMSIYERPCERVLFSTTRDANPFFHLFEGLWMLAGRRDSASLNRYVRGFGERFGEKNGVIHDAYGYRWKHAMGFDQLDAIVQKLRFNSNDRQCVLQMWDATQNFGEAHMAGDDLLGDWKGRPCNTHCYFRVRERVVGQDGAATGVERFLDMTILCRSNDIVMGAYGANAVHFSMMMEYVAGRVGVGVGTMYQFSNNYHGYLRDLDRLGDPRLLMEEIDIYTSFGSTHMVPTQMGTDWNVWDDDLCAFMTWHDGGARNPHGLEKTFANTWFRDVAVPMCRANALRRDGDQSGALHVIEEVVAGDWHQAGRAWLLRHAPKGEIR